MFRASELYVDDPHPGDRIPVKIVISLPNMACECKVFVVVHLFIFQSYYKNIEYIRMLSL